MFGAYFDDSATPGNNPVYLTMACYVASDAQWDLFKPRWKTMLKEEGLKHLHMSELTFRHKWKRVGLYKDWDDAREVNFQKRAHAIIHETTEVGASMSVDVAAYRKTVPIAIDQLLGGPYGFCVFMCMEKLTDYAAWGNWQDPIVCFF